MLEKLRKELMELERLLQEAKSVKKTSTWHTLRDGCKLYVLQRKIEQCKKEIEVLERHQGETK